MFLSIHKIFLMIPFTRHHFLERASLELESLKLKCTVYEDMLYFLLDNYLYLCMMCTSIPICLFVFTSLHFYSHLYNCCTLIYIITLLLQNSMDEVIAATAYLDLFLRRITEPTLLKCFLKFILVEKNDEIVILDSLITRINSNSRVR